MKSDPLKRFIDLRKALESEKTELTSRLEEIDQVLGVASASRNSRFPEFEPARPRGLAPGTGRHGNAKSLKTMVLEAIKDAPLDRKSILEAVVKAGYKFRTKDPLNSLGTLLYTTKEIRNYGGRFGAA